MKIIKVKDYQEMSYQASRYFIDLLQTKPNATLGLATGSSPIGLYQELIKRYQNKEISFAGVKTYNLDEYVGLPLTHPESYVQFMHRNLFDHIDIKKENIHLPYAEVQNPEAGCQAYNEALHQAEIDIQLLGIGANGHIGFNEPFTSFQQETFIVELTEKTRMDNQRFFASLDEVPHLAITMGIKNILEAKQIVLVASGTNKADAIFQLVNGPVSEAFPASALKNHPDVIVIVDEEAASRL
ncbi:MAG: glucosamine-6-phosphate deaminase [Bacilli bacterium]|jgi:glucosamine-6-phosphate deaminase|nr:glucosamine-6-phosphate deaminase [Bacilli bacterium]